MSKTNRLFLIYPSDRQMISSVYSIMSLLIISVNLLCDELPNEVSSYISKTNHYDYEEVFE